MGKSTRIDQGHNTRIGNTAKGYEEDIITIMTTINNIADLVRILKDQPEWAESIRSILLSQELLDLPAQFANFVQLTSQNLELVHERLGHLETAQTETNQRLNSPEGETGNLKGSDYERKVRYGVLHRAQDRLGLDNAYLALTQNDPRATQLGSIVNRAIRSGAISLEESEDLHNADIIISDQVNRHLVVEVSLTADTDDIIRAKRRASILSAACGGTVTPTVVTANLRDEQRDQAATDGVTTFIIPYP